MYFESWRTRAHPLRVLFIICILYIVEKQRLRYNTSLNVDTTRWISCKTNCLTEWLVSDFIQNNGNCFSLGIEIHANIYMCLWPNTEMDTEYRTWAATGEYGGIPWWTEIQFPLGRHRSPSNLQSQKLWYKVTAGQRWLHIGCSAGWSVLQILRGWADIRSHKAEVCVAYQAPGALFYFWHSI